MTHPLDGARAKIERAENHLRNLDATIKSILGPKVDPHSVGHEYQEDRRLLIVKQPKTIPLDPSLPLMVGDCIHNARSALDHLVFQLAILNHASSVSASKISFPICLSDADFKNAVRGKVAPFISAQALAEIENCQPYATGNGGDQDVIWILSQLDIIDKHRLLIVTIAKSRVTGFRITVPSGEQFVRAIGAGEWKPSEDGAEFIRFDLSRAFKESGKVQVDLETASTVQIENTGLECDGMIVQLVLSDCIQLVINIVDAFGEKFFR